MKYLFVVVVFVMVVVGFSEMVSVVDGCGFGFYCGCYGNCCLMGGVVVVCLGFVVVVLVFVVVVFCGCVCFYGFCWWGGCCCLI